MMICQAVQLAGLRLKRTCATWMCQALALAAIMAPLLIILGLKCGIVESMKERLLKDPATLEVRMMGAVDVSDELLTKVRSWPETAFVLPSVGFLYSVVTVSKQGLEEGEEAQMIPTAPGDPLLKDTGVPVPGEGEVVLTERLALYVGAKLDQVVCVRAWRNAHRENMMRELRVVGILPEYRRQDMALLVPLQLTVDAENFIISGSGEAGSDAALFGAVYDGVALERGATAGLVEELRKSNPHLQVLTNENGAFPGAARGGYVLRGKQMEPHQVIPLVRIAEENDAQAWPWVEPIPVKLVCGSLSASVQLVGLENPEMSIGTITPPPVIYVHPGTTQGSGVADLCVQTSEGESRIVCRVQENEDIPIGEARAIPSLLALVRKGQDHVLTWDYRTGGLRFPKMRFISMRLFSRSLEQTEPLYRRMAATGAPCRAQLDVIRQVLALDRSLTRLFLIITTGAALGAIVSFGMSLFNAAELHRRDYALLQLLGMGRVSLAIIPLVDALVTSLAALILAFVCYYTVSTVIGLMFTETVGQGSLCRLHAEHVVSFCAAVGILSAIASFAASVKVLRISPSEIIHES